MSERPRRGIQRKCLVCSHAGNYKDVGKYSEVTVCPKCNGAFVDRFRLEKYQDKPSLTDKPSRPVTEKIKGISIDLENEKQPLLTIELQDESSIPKVFYEGEEITGRIQISFDWITSGARDIGGMEFLIKHVDEKGIAHTIGKSRGDLL